MPWQKHSTLLPSLLGVLLSTVAPLRALAQSIGTVAAVNPSATGTPPGTGPRTLTLGQDLIFNERIQTSGEGSTQLAFADRSTLNVGRNSDIRIDQFVYAPGAGGGQMSISLTKGVLRFVGGQISHTDGATIKTPVASLGVRGGIATVGFSASSTNGGDCPVGGLFINHAGTLTLKNNVSELTIARQGYGVCITSPNEPIPQPFLISDAFLKAYVQNSTSGPGQTGGVKDSPTDQMASKFGLEFPRLDPPGSPPGNPFDIIAIIGSGDSTAQSSAQNAAYGD